MGHYKRYHYSLKNGLQLALISKKTRPVLLALLFLSLLSCSLIFVTQFVNFPPDFSLSRHFPDSLGHEDEALVDDTNVIFPLCSSVLNGTICCDRSSFRADICVMKGDVRTHSPSSSLYIYASKSTKEVINYVHDTDEDNDKEREEEIQHEKIKPYTRKWEANTMSTVDQLHLISKNKNSKTKLKCDVYHDVPSVFFSTAGYTGNVYHEFNDGILPLYITSQHFKKRVMFIILNYHQWWYKKYADIISQLSDFAPIDFSTNKKVHCFHEAIVGLRIHNELTVNPSLMEGGKTIMDFRALLDKSYSPKITGVIRGENRKGQNLPLSPSLKNSIKRRKGNEHPKIIPKLVIISRKGSRVINNQQLLVNMAKKIGFHVEVFTPVRTSELAKIYHILNSSDVMIGVHGAAMTHLLFMRPGSVVIQVVPLGTDWAAETYYAEPAKKLGLKYIGYKIHPRESSLYDEYPKDDTVLTDQDSVVKKGWEFTKKVYLSHQNVRLNLGRFRRSLIQAYMYSFAEKNPLCRPQAH